MKNIVFIVALIALGIQSCKEYLPERTVVTTTVDTTYINPQTPASQNRYVLLEEFTGANCINCPKGHAVLKSLVSTYGDRLNVIGLHQGVLARPVRSNDPDLRTDESASIAAEFSVSGIPVALIDRTDYNGELVLERASWSSAAADALNMPVSVNLEASVKSIQSNICNYKIKIEFPKEYTNEVSYSISLVENGIFVTQKDGSVDIDHYEQNHVLRKMYTPYNGKTLTKTNPTYEKGRTYEKEIKLELNNTWNYNNCEIILYVTDNITKKVLQSNLIHLQ